MPPVVARRFSVGIADRVLSRFLAQRRGSSVAASKKSVVFLGTPSVAASVLETLLEESRQPQSQFEITAVVSQPNKPVGRKNRSIPSPTPVSSLALANGFVADATLLTPPSAKDEDFLTKIEAASPDLCITAAYGNFLPERFLRCPPFGTLNIHPSLLPRYRGAAPVNRALEDGLMQTGVSVAYTVEKMDAGPILTSQTVDIEPDVQAPELLDTLFAIGTRLLIDAMRTVFDGSAVYTPQNPDDVSHAPKMRTEESILHFQSTATELHNKVRAFAPWPGTRATFKLFNTLNSTFKTLELRILKTRIPHSDSIGVVDFHQGVRFVDNRQLFLQCGEGTVLEVLSVQRPGGKAMAIRDFKNGLGKRHILTLG